MLEISDKKIDGGALNGLSLAFIGDSVYELMVREHLLLGGSLQVGKLHSMAVELVRASAQAHFFDVIEPLLTEDERSIMFRGRNAGPAHIPKGARAIEYRKATGFEALFGWLYLGGQNPRLDELFAVVLENLPEKVTEN